MIFPGKREERTVKADDDDAKNGRGGGGHKTDVGEVVPKMMKRGTRPGPRGDQRLVSLGNGDLDDIFGGGVPLNACFGIFLADDDESLASARGAPRTCSRDCS